MKTTPYFVGNCGNGSDSFENRNLDFMLATPAHLFLITYLIYFCLSSLEYIQKNKKENKIKSDTVEKEFIVEEFLFVYYVLYEIF